MDYLTCVIIICVIFLFFIIFLIRTLQYNRKNESIIEGIWYIGCPFAEKSNLNNFIIYIKKGNGHIYDSYITIKKNNSAENKTYEMPLKIVPRSYFSNTEFSFEFEEAVLDIPKKLNMIINYEQSSMTLKCLKDNKIYGVFFKNNKLLDQVKCAINNSDSDSDSESDSDSDIEVKKIN